MTASDMALIGALIFAWGALSARLERADVTAPIIFIGAGLLLTHGPLAVLGIAPGPETVRVWRSCCCPRRTSGWHCWQERPWRRPMPPSALA